MCVCALLVSARNRVLSLGSISEATSAPLFGHSVRTTSGPAAIVDFRLLTAGIVMYQRLGLFECSSGTHTASDGASPFSFRIENEKRGKQ
jgi:hypothetical protein